MIRTVLLSPLLPTRPSEPFQSQGRPAKLRRNNILAKSQIIEAGFFLWFSIKNLYIEEL